VSVAWLEAPEGSQLLLVANENFCTWQPTEKASKFTSDSFPYDRGATATAAVSHAFAARNACLSQGDIKLHPLLIQLLA
jgi:hypothetical protein